MSKDILEKGLLPGMDIVGQRFKVCEMFIPEVLRSAKCMHDAMNVIRPLLSASDAAGAGTVVLGAVEGDLHDIGKNLVGSMLEGAGFEVFDVGIDVPPEKFLEAVRSRNAHILALSALLTFTMPEMKNVIAAFEQSGVRNQVKIIVGGAPVTRGFADEIGADGYGENASSAVTLARTLLGK